MASAPDEMETHLNELQKKFDRLKVLYEQYFMGVERTEPLVVRKEVTRAILDLQQMNIRKTGLRFKVSTLIQKWNIYQTYWNRTMRDIEAGRYVRHVATARRRAVEKGLDFPAEAMGLHLPEAKATDGPSAPPVAPPAPAEVVRRPVPATASVPRGAVPGLSEEEMRALHGRIVAAQRSAGDQAAMRYEVLVTQLSRQVPKLLEEYKCQGVAFDVVTKDGKVRLKPRPLR